MKYPDSPVLYIFLFIVTSWNSIFKTLSLLSNVISTSANDNGFLACVPANMMSSDLLPLKDLILCSPRHHLIASDILLFPEPFGPIAAVIPPP